MTPPVQSLPAALINGDGGNRTPIYAMRPRRAPVTLRPRGYKGKIAF